MDSTSQSGKWKAVSGLNGNSGTTFQITQSTKRAVSQPRVRPIIPSTKPSRAASARKMERMSPRFAPMARMMPISRRRSEMIMKYVFAMLIAAMITMTNEMNTRMPVTNRMTRPTVSALVSSWVNPIFLTNARKEVICFFEFTRTTIDE